MTAGQQDSRTAGQHDSRTADIRGRRYKTAEHRTRPNYILTDKTKKKCGVMAVGSLG